MLSSRSAPGAAAAVAAPIPAERPGRSTRGWGVAVFLLYLAGGVVAYAHVWAHPATVQPGSGGGDIARYDWFIAWVPWAITHAVNPFVSHMANVPFGVNLMDDTSVLGLGLVMTPVTLLLGPVVSVNVLFTLAYPLSAGAGYLLAREFVPWRPAAFAAGLLYGFSPYMVAEGSGHLNLSFVPLPPLIFLALYRLFVAEAKPGRRIGVLLGVLVAGQVLISAEVGAITLLFASLTLLLLAVTHPALVASRARRALPGFALGVAIAAALTAFPLYEAVGGPAHIAGRIPGFEDYYSEVLGPVLPTHLLHFTTHHLSTLAAPIGGNLSENGSYLGLPLIVLAVLAGVRIRSGAVRVGVVMAAVAFVLSLGRSLHLGSSHFGVTGAHIPLPGALLFHVPKLNDSYPVRYALFVVLFLVPVLAVSLDRAHGWGLAREAGSGRAAGALAPLAVAVAVLLPLLPAWPYWLQGRVRVPSFFTTSDVRSIPAGPAAPATLVYPYPTNDNAAAMAWQAAAGIRFRMLGGYFVVGGPMLYFTPTGVERTLTDLAEGRPPARTAPERRRLTAELRRWNVQTIVLQPIGSDPVGFMTWLAGKPPDATVGGMVEWYRVTWAPVRA